MKYPPTTLLACMLIFLPLVVSCQSQMGTLLGVWVMYLWMGNMSVLKFSFLLASVALHNHPIAFGIGAPAVQRKAVFILFFDVIVDLFLIH